VPGGVLRDQSALSPFAKHNRDHSLKKKKKAFKTKHTELEITPCLLVFISMNIKLNTSPHASPSPKLGI
jgi:hypothetical protein